jgi:dipeptidyl aminopeptidase/acylaminoacyl peptidase
MALNEVNGQCKRKESTLMNSMHRRLLVGAMFIGFALIGQFRFGGRARAEEPTRLEKYVPTAAELEAVLQRPPRPGPVSGVYKAQLTPHWFDNSTRFWYRNDLKGGTREFILVDAERGTRQAAFDHEKLAAALSRAAGTEYKPERLPFDSIEFADEGKSLLFKVGGAAWKCDLRSYECSKSDAKPKGEPAKNPDPAESLMQAELNVLRQESLWPEAVAPDPQQPEPPARAARQTVERFVRSPDGRRTALIRDFNVSIRSEDGKETQFTKDGKDGLAYGMLEWSPDSRSLVAFRIEPGERKEVYLLESSPAGGGRARLHSRPYPLPGDKFTSYELHLFDAAEMREIKSDVEKIDFGAPRVRWQRGGHTFTYQKTDRGHQRFRLIEVDAQTGEARHLIDEQSKTFIWTAHTENVGINTVTWLQKTDEIVYVSERDGWRHLYLIDAKEGKIKHPITKGEWVVRGVDRIDEAKRQIWFRAGGLNPDQDPYFIHFYRINFDGTELVALTEGNGTHSIRYSPDGKCFIDTYSRVDLPPVHELRRTADGKLVTKLEEADISELKANGWQPPEVLVAKGRDGKTDIWGLLCRPRNFDPNKRYAVIENIYAGPQGSFVPKTFSAGRLYADLADLGFIVAKVDGMGTANRSKAFHDVCWKNLKDAGFPDRILWHQAAAKKHPQYDISRVGIYGGSAGGQNAMDGLLFHPEFYKVGVAGCGCHDNRMDKASWNEQWMGYPVGPQYAECSNVDNAQRLKGRLLLILGEMDNNVPPESTYRVVDALIKARKDFEMLVVPGAGHGMGGAYGNRRLKEFFVRHLHGVEPPSRNGG